MTTSAGMVCRCRGECGHLACAQLDAAGGPAAFQCGEVDGDLGLFQAARVRLDADGYCQRCAAHLAARRQPVQGSLL